jgi:hypothetical protein
MDRQPVSIPLSDQRTDLTDALRGFRAIWLPAKSRFHGHHESEIELIAERPK